MFKIVVFFLLICLLIFTFYLPFPQSSGKKSLKVLTYSSFAGVHGPGRIIKEKFEAFCECEVHWFLAEDSTALWQRFSIVPEIDLVIGWDQITLKSAGSAVWENLSELQKSPFPNSHFLPLNWSPIGFLYKEGTTPVFSLKSLYKIQGTISFPEPKTSTLGLQFYYWIYEVFAGDRKQVSDFLSQLKNKVYGPVFSWSMAYGFFQKGQTDMGLSYLSSLLYHQKTEQNKAYFFADFTEGHPYQIEFLSVSKTSKNKQLALDLAGFLLSTDIQQLIQKTHYMFPVYQGLKVPKLLNLKSVQLISYQKLDEFIKQKNELLELWKKNLY